MLSLKGLYLLVRKGNTLKILLVTLCLVLILLSYHLPSVLDKIETVTKPQSSFTSRDLSISQKNLNKIHNYMQSIVTSTDNPSVKLVSLYKFIPQGTQYKYQGRALVDYVSFIPGSTDLLTLFRDAGYDYIPMWTDKYFTSVLLSGEKANLVLTKDGDEYVNGQLTEDAPTLNTSIFSDLDITDGVVFPVMEGSRVVGFIAFFGKDVKDVESLNAKLQSYILPLFTEL